MSLFPFAVVLQVTPIIAIAPLILIYVQSTFAALLICAWIVAFFPILSNTAIGLRSADHNLRDLFTLYKATPWQKLRYLMLPSALPYFMAGLKIAAALTPIGALYGDTVAGMGSGDKAGLGFVVVIFSAQFKIPALFASAFVACVIGFLFVSIVNLLAWFTLHKWHDSYVFSN